MGATAKVNFKGANRSNDTHQSTTDPDTRLCSKGRNIEGKPCFLGDALMENRLGLVVDACLTPAGDHSERIAALSTIGPGVPRHARSEQGLSYR